MQQLSVIDTTSTPAHQSWGWWLLWATLIYGVVPRALALGFCVARLWFSQHAIGRRFDRPGFARLRARLMPDSRTLAVADPDTDKPLPAPTPQFVEASLSGSVHGVGLDDAVANGPPAFDGVKWTWLGQVNDPAAEATVLERLGTEHVSMLAVVVRATMTPDRGIERVVKELIAAARSYTAIVLVDLDVLDARGSGQRQSRIAHWQALAHRSGAQGIVLRSTGDSHET